MTLSRPLFCLAATSALQFSAAAVAADCYVDSVAGSDGNDGQSQTTPLQTQAALPSGCGTVHYKRGSHFDEALRVVQGASTYTNYGDSGALPEFVVPHTTNSGSIVSSFQGGITIDGLYMAGSKGDGTLAGLTGGICILLGSNSQVLNSEISNCDVGMMILGEGSLVQGNYFHDMTLAADGDSSVDPNSVGGANGIFINGSNNEIAYNTFVNCSATAEWTGGSCDGGATEVSVGAGETVTGVKVHHNFSLNSCGFFEVASIQGDSLGTFTDSEFYYNVHVDGGWLMLLQVNNTNLSGIRWENNTVVQHAGSSNAGMLTTVFTGSSSGVSGGELALGAVSMTNNLIVFSGVSPLGNAIDPAITQVTNLILDASQQDPGFVNLAGMTAQDYDLVAASPAINQGTTIADHPLDFVNRSVPDPNGVTDIGAFEYGAVASGEGPDTPMVTSTTTSSATTSSSTGSSTTSATATTGETGTVTGSGGSSTGTGTDASAATATNTGTSLTTAASADTGGVSTASASTAAMAPSTTDDGGCGCSMPGGRAPGVLAFGAPLALLLLERRRRARC